MADIFLIIDVARNLVVNADGITLLRNLNLVQGTSYTVFLSFYSGGVQTTTPTIDVFNFSAYSGSTLVLQSTTLTDSGNSLYPKQFTLVADSDRMTAALVGIEIGGVFVQAACLTADISWDTTDIAPFPTTVQGSGSDGGGNVSSTLVNYVTTSTPGTISLDFTSPYLWFVDATLSNATFNLPDASTVPGKDFTFTKVDSSANTVTARAVNSQQVENRDGVYIRFRYDQIHVISNGSAWFVLDAIALVPDP